MNDNIVVTGIGLITPQGCGREQSWTNIKNGVPIFSVPPDPSLPSTFVRFSPFINPNGLHRIFPLALASVREALSDSGIDLREISPDRVGCSFSVSKPILLAPSIREDSRDISPFLKGGVRGICLSPDSVLQFLLRELNISGPSLNVIAACSTGVHSLFIASRWLMEKRCDIAIAGSAESTLHNLFISGFSQMGVLSDFPCPFDKNRKGFMIGEGAGALILERKSDALARGARIYSEILSCSLGSDSNLPTAFDPDGSSVSSVLKKALHSSCSPSFSGYADIGYINAHGTGTRANDLIETRAIKRVFGKRANDLSISSTKSSTGHLLGASGSVEAALTCLALRGGYVPPTANLKEPDPECDLDYTPVMGKQKDITTALSLSMGFGGPIGAVVFRRHSG